MRSGLEALAAAGCRVCSVHPMFGPDTRLLSGRHLIVCDAGCAEATEAAKQLFASTMVEQLDMSLEDHDRLIAYVLGLSHALNIPHLYFEIQNLNKFGLGPLDALAEAADRIRELVAKGDEQGFVELMQKGREYFEMRG